MKAKFTLEATFETSNKDAIGRVVRDIEVRVERGTVGFRGGLRDVERLNAAIVGALKFDPERFQP